MRGDRELHVSDQAEESNTPPLEQDAPATRGRSRLTAEERLSELVMMGLRLTEGISRAAFRRETGQDLEDCMEARRLAAPLEAGYLEVDSLGIRATAAGRQRLNALCGYLLAETATVATA